MTNDKHVARQRLASSPLSRFPSPALAASSSSFRGTSLAGVGTAGGAHGDGGVGVFFAGFGEG